MKKVVFAVLLSAVLCFAYSCGKEAESQNPENVNNTRVTETAAPNESLPDDMARTEKSAAEDSIADTHDKDEEAADSVDETTDEPKSASGYVCTFDNGTKIEIGAAVDDIPSLYGEPLSYAEAPSCIHEGYDKVYTYDGYTLTTSPDADGNSRIYEISLTSDVVAFENGVTIGSELSQVASAFGEEYTEQFGVIMYELDDVSISIVLDGDDCVISLVVTAKI